MAYYCRKGYKDECDGCGDCNEGRIPICPVCGEVVHETVYKTIEGDIFGCENCVECCDPEELLEDED